MGSPTTLLDLTLSAVNVLPIPLIFQTVINQNWVGIWDILHHMSGSSTNLKSHRQESQTQGSPRYSALIHHAVIKLNKISVCTWRFEVLVVWLLKQKRMHLTWGAYAWSPMPHPIVCMRCGFSNTYRYACRAGALVVVWCTGGRGFSYTNACVWFEVEVPMSCHLWPANVTECRLQPTFFTL